MAVVRHNIQKSIMDDLAEQFFHPKDILDPKLSREGWKVYHRERREKKITVCIDNAIGDRIAIQMDDNGEQITQERVIATLKATFMNL